MAKYREFIVNRSPYEFWESCWLNFRETIHASIILGSAIMICMGILVWLASK